LPWQADDAIFYQYAAANGKKLDDVLRSLALRMSNSAFNSAMNQLENATGSLFGNIFSGLGGML
jgi:phage-related minor tail protein